MAEEAVLEGDLAAVLPVAEAVVLVLVARVVEVAAAAEDSSLSLVVEAEVALAPEEEVLLEEEEAEAEVAAAVVEVVESSSVSFSSSSEGTFLVPQYCWRWDLHSFWPVKSLGWALMHWPKFSSQTKKGRVLRYSATLGVEPSPQTQLKERVVWGERID